MTLLKYDPVYVQITKADAAQILGITTRELDRRRVSDERCPPGFRDWTTFPPATRFRLTDIYRYSESIIKEAKPAPVELLLSQPENSEHL